MKKNLSRLAVGAACVLAVFGLFKTASLKQEISRLQSDLNNQIRALNNSINAIYDNVDAMLEEQNNLFSVSNWAYGDIDVEAKTAEVVCTIVPKAYTPGVTQAVMVCGGQEYPMSYADNRYTATLSLPLFEPAGDWQVRLADNGSLRTQRLDWFLDPKSEALLCPQVSIQGTSTGRQGEKGYDWTPAPMVVIDIEKKGAFQVRSVELVEVLDGQEIGRIPVDLTEEGQKAYAEALSKQSFAIPEPVSTVSASPDYQGHANFLYCLDKLYLIPRGSLLELFVDVVDQNGFRYRCSTGFSGCMAVTLEGERDDVRMKEIEMDFYENPILIFDKDGSVIYDASEPSLS